MTAAIHSMDGNRPADGTGCLPVVDRDVDPINTPTADVKA